MPTRGKSAPSVLCCADTDLDCADADSDGNADDQLPVMEDLVRTVTGEGTEKRWDGYHIDMIPLLLSPEESLAVPQNADSDGNAEDQLPVMEDLVRTVTGEGTAKRWD